MYRSLDSAKIISTIDALEQRIAERFPGSGLGKVCADLVQLARESEQRVVEIAKPNIALRAGIAAILATGAFLLMQIASIIELKRESENLSGILQGIDSAFNILLLMGAGMLFLSSLETRWKRHKVMERLHELRSIVHVIDMHQLPKDPSSNRPATVAVAEHGLPPRVLSSFELTRYLDYCSEMLSLTGKVAALYAQSTKDSIVIDAASDIGQITTNLSSKIWQKITLVQAREGRNVPLPLPAAPVMPVSDAAPKNPVTS